MGMGQPRFDHITFQVTIPSTDHDDPDRYIRTYEGVIKGGIDEDDDDQYPTEEELGNVRLFIVERERVINDGESLFEVMDCLSPSTLDMYEALVNGRTGDWKERVKNLIDENRGCYPNTMLIDRVELKPEFRGHGIGPSVVRQVIDTLGASCELIACKPFPLQYCGYMGDRNEEQRKEPAFERTRKAAWKKVRSIWEQTGFIPVKGTEYYLWPE
jgi:GNAT superfamily N-acetyltransferase